MTIFWSLLFCTCKEDAHHIKIKLSLKPTNRPFLPAATKLGQDNIFRSVCQEFCPQGEVWSREGRGVPPNFRGGLQFFGRGFPPTSFGGAVGGFLQFFWGGVSPIFWGVLRFLGGLQNFFSSFFSIFFPPKKSFWDAPTDRDRDGQCAAGTHPTGMHFC